MPTKCSSIWHTVYHESFEAEQFHGFHVFSHVCEIFLYETSRWRCSSMDLRESMRDSVKVSSQRSACITCRETFLHQTFMLYGNLYSVGMDNI